MSAGLNFCTNCGASVPTGTRFCGVCGNALSGPNVTQRASGQRDPVAELEALLRGATRGDYEIEGLLGQGGMAAVFKARDLQLDRPVAIKILPPEYTFGQDMVERFRREARTAAQLNHPNIIPIYRIGEAGPTLYFVMKLVEGRTLESIMRDLGHLDVKMVSAIIGQVCAPVDYAHRRGVVHRDLKPSNVMVDEEGYAVVMDFGIAKASDNMAITATGAALGTPYYMSPEQCSGKPVTGASDQYAIGVMAYQMFAGTLPFEGESAQEIIAKHFFEEPPPLAGCRPDLPASIHEAVHRAMAKQPGDRFKSVADFAAALGAAAAAPDDAMRTQMQLLSHTLTGERPVVTPIGQLRPEQIATPQPRTPPPEEIPTEVVAARPAPPPAPAHAPTPATPLPSARAAPPTPKRRKGAMIGVAAGLVLLGGTGVGLMIGSRGEDESPSAVATTPPATEPPVSEAAADPAPEVPTTAAPTTAAPETRARERPARAPARQEPPARQPAAAEPPPVLAPVGRPDLGAVRIAAPEVRVPVTPPPAARVDSTPPTRVTRPPAPAPQASVEIRLTDAVRGLVVTVNGRRAEVGAEGVLRLTPGTYTLGLSAPGHVARSREYTFAAGDLRVISAALRRQ